METATPRIRMLKHLLIKIEEGLAQGGGHDHPVRAPNLQTCKSSGSNLQAQILRLAGFQTCRFSSRTGSLRMRWPVAWKIALQTAALVPTLPSSPSPLTPAGLILSS